MKFSVLMSVYGKENPKLFDLALNSIFNNTIHPDEMVLICDGPLTNELNDIIASYIERYKNILGVIRRPVNSGLAAALNIGLEHVKAEWVVRADSDDINISTRFEVIRDFIKNNPDVAVFGSHIIEVSPDGTKLATRKVPLDDYAIKRRLKNRNPFNHMTVAFKVDIAKRLGGYPILAFREDYGLWAKMAANGCKMANIDQVLVHATTGENMYRRRGGISYAFGEFAFQKFLVKNNLKTFPEACFSAVLRILVFLMPTSVRKFVYEKFLRH
jgi:glycosyltransferase involved in cell wall biosynthesis